MSVAEFMIELSRQQVQIWAEGDELCVRAPKGTLTPDQRATLADRKVEILALLRERTAKDERSKLPQIISTPEERFLPFPMTDIQASYWIGGKSSFELGRVACQIYVEIESTSLDMNRLSAAWGRMIKRHDVLRLTILPDGRQQILEKVPKYEIEVLDLRGQTPDSKISQLEAVRRTMSHHLARTENWPLFEIRVSQLDDERSRLHFRIELMGVDALSVLVLFKQWFQLYLFPSITLPALDLSFRDYVLSEIAFRDSEQYEKCQEYWFNRLSTLPPGPDLPLAQSPGSIDEPEFVRRMARLNQQTWDRFVARSRRAGLTPSGALCAAFAEILTTWSKSPRFTLNLTFFNRLPIHPQVNDILGDFTSTILLEVDGSAASFETRAQQLQKQLAQDLDYSQFNGVRVLREMNRIKGGSTAALAPVVFTSLVASGIDDSYPTDQLGDIVYSITQTPQVWLDHQLFVHNGTLVLTWDAVEALFPNGLLDEMFAAYVRLLERLADDESAWLDTSTPLVPLPAAQSIQRVAVNDTAGPEPRCLLHTLALDQMQRQPGQPAVITATRSLSYAELHQRAWQAAHWLRRQDCRPNQLVAVVMEKGWEQVVGVLGVLFAGAAYLPIDPDLPEQRLLYLLEHGEVTTALTQSWVNDKLPWPEHVTRLCLDQDEQLKDLSTEEFESTVTEEDLAYVIYTSGSTGEPKGVMITHRAVVNSIVDINERFGVGPDDRVFALSALGFDLSVYDIFGMLAAGAAIVMPGPHEARTPGKWVELMERERVTIWNSVPALMEMIVEYVSQRETTLPSSLRLVLLSGDWIPVQLPDQIKSLVEGVNVISLGGATEASIWSILYPIAKPVKPGWTSIPYGQPMKNQSFHVLNERLDPCPVWVTGHLYIGGVGLASGYWHDEEKTNGSFIVQPQTGQRLYRTGDLGRYLPDGNIEFLGREDLQVKILGNRIELGEIEATLSRHPAVRTAVVSTVGELRGHKRLVGYVVSSQEEKPTQAELRAFLKQKLPDYMVPTVFLMIDALPLSANGKIDRQALPTFKYVSRDNEKGFVAPRTPTEETVAKVICQVLGVEQVGVYDNFFEMGGESLLAIQALGALERTFQVEIPIVDLFDEPNVAGLALVIEERIIDQLLADSETSVEKAEPV